MESNKIQGRRLVNMNVNNAGLQVKIFHEEGEFTMFTVLIDAHKALMGNTELKKNDVCLEQNFLVPLIVKHLETNSCFRHSHINYDICKFHHHPSLQVLGQTDVHAQPRNWQPVCSVSAPTAHVPEN